MIKWTRLGATFVVAVLTLSLTPQTSARGIPGGLEEALGTK